MKAISSLSLFFAIIVFSCTQPPDYPPEPVIAYERVSRKSMLQGKQNNDSIQVVFSYTDGDGDLGNDGDSIDVFVYDSRIPELPHAIFKLPVVPPQGTGNGISGEVSLVVYNTCCLFPNNEYLACDTPPEYPFDTLQFEIEMYDRAGNKSNRVITEDIFLRCQ